MVSKERFIQLAVATGISLVSGFGTFVALEFHMHPDQNRVIPHGDIMTGRDTTVRSMAVTEAMVSGGFALIGLAVLRPEVLSHRRKPSGEVV